MKSSLSVLKTAAATVVCATIAAGSANAGGYNWSGVYFGGHIGKAESSIVAKDILPPLGGFYTPRGPASGQGFDFDQDGLIGGGQVGIQHQWGNFVAGGEISLSGAKLAKDIVSPYYPTSDTETARISNIFTATGRLGFAFDNWLLYVKGGYASGHVTFEAFDRIARVGYTHNARQSGTVIGGGFEYGLLPNVTLGLEYTKIDLGDKTISGFRSSGFPETYRTDADLQTITARLNILIGRDGSRAAAAPLK